MTPVLEIDTGVEGLVLGDAFAALADLYAKVDAHAEKLAAPLELPCKPGCSACCRQSVFITPLEALYLVHHIQGTRDALAIEALLGQAEHILATQRERIFSFGHPSCPGAPPLGADDLVARPKPLDRVLTARLLQFDCPLLDPEGLCTVYPARELRARLFAISKLKSRDEYYACDLLGSHLDGREVRLMDAEAVQAILQLHPLTQGEQVIPYYLWRYASLLR